MQPAVLFVCLGNICRSPLAEIAMRQAAEQAGIQITIDSAATMVWHVGKAPDERAQSVARRHGLDISGHRARQIVDEDYTRFTHICALDRGNLTSIRNLAPPGATARLSMLLDWVDGRKGQSVADPYFGDESAFDETWADVSAGATALVRHFRS